MRGVSVHAKAVLFIIADASNKDNECWLSQATIGEDAGIARQNVSRYTRELEQAGVIRVEVSKR